MSTSKRGEKRKERGKGDALILSHPNILLSFSIISSVLKKTIASSSSSREGREKKKEKKGELCGDYLFIPFTSLSISSGGKVAITETIDRKGKGGQLVCHIAGSNGSPMEGKKKKEKEKREEPAYVPNRVRRSVLREGARSLEKEEKKGGADLSVCATKRFSRWAASR